MFNPQLDSLALRTHTFRPFLSFAFPEIISTNKCFNVNLSLQQVTSKRPLVIKTKQDISYEVSLLLPSSINMDDEELSREWPLSEKGEETYVPRLLHSQIWQLLE